MSAKISTFLILLSLLLAIVVYQQHKNAATTTAQLASLKAALSEAQQKLTSESPAPEKPIYDQKIVDGHPEKQGKRSSEQGQLRNESATPFRAAPDPIGVGRLATKYFIEELEKEMVLSEGEKEHIREEVQSLIAQGIPLSTQASIAILEGIIDINRFEKYRKDTLQKEAQDKARRLMDSTVLLSRKLKLTHEQQFTVGAILTEMREELAPAAEALKQQTASFRAKLIQGEMDQETLVQGHQEMDVSYKSYSEKKKNLLNSKLQHILTEDQYNTLLEEQASSDTFIEQSTNF